MTSDWWVYSLGSSNNISVSLCIISKNDYRNLLHGKVYPSSFLDFTVLQRFTTLVSKAVGISQLDNKSLIAVARDGEILWEYMRSCGVLEVSITEDLCPCVGWSLVEKRFYRIEYTLPNSPSTFAVDKPTSSLKRQHEEYNLCQFYLETLGVQIEANQGILVSHMGPAIPLKQISDHSKMRTNKPSAKGHSVKYLVPQLVSFHSLTFIQDKLTDLRRHLTWLDAGLVATKITMLLSLSGSLKYTSLATLFIPPGIRSFRSSLVTLMHVALTCPIAQLTFTNEKLEWLGDAVWRFLAAFAGLEQPFIRIHFSTVLSNERMGTLAARHVPDLGRIFEPNLLPNVVEAIIAVAFIHGGLECSNQVARVMGLYSMEDLPTNIPSGNRTESFLNGAVITAFQSLNVSFEIITASPHNSLGQWTDTRKTGIKLFPKEIPQDHHVLEQWEQSFLRKF